MSISQQKTHDKIKTKCFRPLCIPSIDRTQYHCKPHDIQYFEWNHLSSCTSLTLSKSFHPTRNLKSTGITKKKIKKERFGEPLCLSINQYGSRVNETKPPLLKAVTANLIFEQGLSKGEMVKMGSQNGASLTPKEIEHPESWQSTIIFGLIQAQLLNAVLSVLSLIDFSFFSLSSPC